MEMHLKHLAILLKKILCTINGDESFLAKKHNTAKKEKRLEKAGFFAEKGKFGFVKKDKKGKRKGGKTQKAQ